MDEENKTTLCRIEKSADSPRASNVEILQRLEELRGRVRGVEEKLSVNERILNASFDFE